MIIASRQRGRDLCKTSAEICIRCLKATLLSPHTSVVWHAASGNVCNTEAGYDVSHRTHTSVFPHSVIIIASKQKGHTSAKQAQCIRCLEAILISSHTSVVWHGVNKMLNWSNGLVKCLVHSQHITNESRSKSTSELILVENAHNHDPTKRIVAWSYKSCRIAAFWMSEMLRVSESEHESISQQFFVWK